MNQNLYRVRYNINGKWTVNFDMGPHQFYKIVVADFECIAEVYADSLEEAQNRVEQNATIFFGWVQLPVEDSELNRVEESFVLINGAEYASMSSDDYDKNAIDLLRWLETAENARQLSLNTEIYFRGDDEEDHIVTYEGVQA